MSRRGDLAMPDGYWERYGAVTAHAPSTGAVQLRGAEAPEPSSEQVHEAAVQGTAGAAQPLPFLDQIQRSFGHHDLSGIKAHTDGQAAAGARAMGAEAFATGDHVAFGRSAPSLHTAAHEAAHVVQQRAGVHLKGGVGEANDAHEQHANAIADRVVRGESSEALLDAYAGPSAGGATGSGGVQRMILPIGDLKELPRNALDQEIVDAQTISTSANRLSKNNHGSVEHLDSDNRPLAKLGNSEELIITAHGGSELLSEVAETFGGRDPAQLVTALVSSGLKKSYCGSIYLNGCNSATKEKEKKSYVERFQAALVKKEIFAEVRGNAGPSHTMPDGQTGFKKEGSEEAFREGERYMMQLQGLMRTIENIEFFQKHPMEVFHPTWEGAPEALGFNPNDKLPSEGEIQNALSKKLDEKLRQAEELKLKRPKTESEEEIWEPRPDKITTLPRPQSDNEMLVRVAGIGLLGFALAAKAPPLGRYLVFFLALALMVAFIMRTLGSRPK